MAMEESRVLIWHRDKLRLSIIGEPYLQTVFDHVLGKDVVKKLMQVIHMSDVFGLRVFYSNVCGFLGFSVEFCVFSVFVFMFSLDFFSPTQYR